MEPARPRSGQARPANPFSRLHSPDLLQVVIDSALAAVVTMGEDGRINGWSAVAERTFGWPTEEAVGQRLSELIVPPRYRASHDAGLERYRRTGEGPVLGSVMELEALHKDGHEFPVEIRISPAAKIDGETIFIAFVADISVRHEAEARVAAQVTEIAEAKAGVEDYVRMMVHEMRQPLALVTGYSELLLEEFPADSPARHHLEVIVENARETSEMVEDLLLAARLEAGSVQADIQPFDLAEVVDEALSRVRPRAALRNGAITADALPSQVRVRGDRAFTARILDNLLNNAVAYSPAPPAVEVRAEVDGEEIAISVADRGRGIPAHLAERIFERFARVNERDSPPGTGLGLYISRQLAEHQQGTLSLMSSTVGAGSTFCLRLTASPG
ncbi:MAG: ATP-binding protein [Candidatus Dormibacteria bacterium]